MNSNYFNFQSINVENMNGIDELEGRRVYCSGRDLHAISHVSLANDKRSRSDMLWILFEMNRRFSHIQTSFT